MPEQTGEFAAIVSNLSEIHEDVTVPRNVRVQIQTAISVLQASAEPSLASEEREAEARPGLSIKASKILTQLDEIANDPNLQPYTRIQIWNVISVLEKLR